MSISDAQYAQWLLEDRHDRCILVEATYSAGTEYFSTSAFVSGPSDTPANISYEDLILSVPEIEASIDGDVTIGEIELDNSDGDRDTWLNRAWRGWTLKVYLGAVDWSRDDFRLIVNGINDGISSSNPETLNFGIRDKRELLQEVVQTGLMTSGEPKPLSLGTVFNAEPVLESAASLIYRFHEDSNASVTDVRDNGVSLGAGYTDNSDGTFTLSASPAGRITCDVSGDTTGTPAAIVEWLAKRSPEISSGDIDSTNLAAFSATYGLGLYIRDQRTISDCISDVMQSVGGVALFSRLGLLQMVRLEVPGTSVLSLITDDVVEHGLSISTQEEPVKRVTLGYGRNWTIQDEGTLAGSVSAANRDLYGKEYSKVTSDNATIATTYPLAVSPEMVGTLIVSSANAQTEADRRKTLRGSKRTQYSAEVFSAPFQVQLGQTITLTYPRFGFSAGQKAVVISIQQLPTKNKVVLGVWR